MTIIGEIRIGPDDRPVVVRVIDARDNFTGTRECEHGDFTLDRRWSTVTCGRCGREVQPFDALCVFAEHWDRLKRQEERAEEAERKLHLEHLRTYARRRDAHPSLRALTAGWAERVRQMPLPQLRALVSRVERSRGREPVVTDAVALAAETPPAVTP